MYFEWSFSEASLFHINSEFEIPSLQFYVIQINNQMVRLLSRYQMYKDMGKGKTSYIILIHLTLWYSYNSCEAFAVNAQEYRKKVWSYK